MISTYAQDVRAQELLTKLSITPDAVPGFTLRDGLLRYNHRVWVGHSKNLQTKLIVAVHSTAIGGHSGVAVTYRCLKQIFAWQGMKSAI